MFDGYTFVCSQEDPSEAMYQYEIEVCGVRVRNSKLHPRELTEEEKAEVEAKAAKGGKAPPKGKPADEKQPTPEELEKLEQERLKKEEMERQRQAEWEALDEETKFYRTSEDVFKEPSIKMQN